MQRFRTWAARAPKRFLAVIGLAVVAYLGVKRITEYLRIDHCLDSGGSYDYQQHLCRHSRSREP